jgi:hypothetical protein
MNAASIRRGVRRLFPNIPFAPMPDDPVRFCYRS